MRERRGFVRLEVDAHVLYKVKGMKGCQNMVTLDELGYDGIRVISSNTLNDKDLLELTLQIPGIEGDIVAEGKVIWQRQVTMELLDIGMEFTKIDDKNKHKLLKFIENITGKSDERRKYVRCNLSTSIKYNFISNPDIGSQCAGIDVCTLGLKILTKEKLEKGTQLVIDFNLPGEEQEIVAKCIVVAWVKQGKENLFETGIEFLEISEEDKEKITKYIKKTFSVKK